MKGTFFQRPLEYKIDLEGESWFQGDTLKGTLNISNHGTDEIDLSETGCHLCFVDIKKMKAKNEKAFTFLDSKLIENDSNLDFEFKLGEACQITETGSSLYILCGNKEKPFEGGLLQLQISPTKIIQNFIETFENFFRFKFKTLKNKKGFIEAKVVAPTAKEWSKLQGLTLKMRLVDSNLELDYQFKIKSVSFDTGAMETKDSKLSIASNLSAKQHSSFGGSANQEGMMSAITEVLDQVKLKPMI
jgi:hypothetical protein